MLGIASKRFDEATYYSPAVRAIRSSKARSIAGLLGDPKGLNARNASSSLCGKSGLPETVLDVASNGLWRNGN